MGWCERSWRWAALVSSLVLAGVFAVVPSASSSADSPRGRVRAPGGPYAVGGDAVAFSPHGRWLATAGEGVSVLRVNQRTGRLRRVAHVPSPGLEAPQAVAFSPDGRFLATAGITPSDARPTQLLIFRVNRYNGTLREVAGMSRKRDERITDVAFDPTGRFLAIPGECGVQILALNRRTGALRRLPHSSYPSGRASCDPYVRFDPNGNLLVASGGSGDSAAVLYVVNMRTGRLRETAEWSDGSDSSSGEVSFTPDGRLLAVPIVDNCGVAVLSVGRGHKLKEVSGSPFLHRSCPNPVELSPDGRTIAYIAIPPRIALLSFNEQTGAVQAPLGSPIRTGGRYPQALAFSPNGKLLVVGNGIA